MCDYSLELYASRPARAGEVYATTRFSSGCLGLAAPGDCSTAVCVQYDTRVELENMPKALRDALGLQACETATFVRLDRGDYRDGLRFANGREIPLQHLGPGVGVTIPQRVAHAPRPERAATLETASA